MAGLLPPTLIQYNLTTLEKTLEMVALIATGKMQYMTSVDGFDPFRLISVGTPNLLLKNSLSMVERFKTEGENVPGLIEEVTVYGTNEIDKFNNIIFGFIDKIQALFNTENATVAAITKCIIDFVLKVISFILASVTNIITLVIRDLINNCIFVLIQILTWWPPYILETATTGLLALMTPDLDPVIMGATPWDVPRGMHGIFEAIWITLLMIYQILLIIFEILNLIIRIIEYIIATIIGELLMIVTFISKLTALSIQLPVVLIEFIEQLLGLLSTQPLPIMLMSGMTAAILELTAIQTASTAAVLL